jgi:hypothetical protein
MIYDCCMRKKTAKKSNSNKRGSKNVDSWGLRMVKNVGGALPLVGLLVGGAALAGGAVAVSKMSNAEEDGLEVDQELDRTLQGITLNNTPSITSPSPSTTTSSNTTSASTTSRNNGVGARTGGLQNQTHTETTTRTPRHGNNSTVTSRLRSQTPSQFLNVDMNEFERGLSSSSIRNIQQQMVNLFNRDSEQNGNVVGIAMTGERLDDSFADGVIGPRTRAFVYMLKRGTGFRGPGQSAIDSHMDQHFTAELDRRSRGITNYSWGLGTIKTVSRKRRLR